MRLRFPTSRLDAAAITTATAVAALGAAGVRIESLPIERIGEAADLAAGAFAVRHWLHRRKHSQAADKPALVTVVLDGRGHIISKR